MSVWADMVQPWVSIVKGSVETLRQMFTPAITLQYPHQDTRVSPRWRGPLRLRGVMDEEPPPVTDAPPLEFNDLMTSLHEQQKVAPCMGGCPANVDARGQNALVAAGRSIEAYEVVRRRNILPGVLGYVCNNPCEDVCRRSYFEEPIAIRQLHRHCFEVYDREVRAPGHLKSLVTRKEHVAVVGAGPAGLAVAFDLVQIGYRVTIFEKELTPGGLLVTGIPLYRLDRTVVAKEIDDLVQMGIEMKLGAEVGKDVTLAQLRSQHDAVVVTVGYSGGRVLPLPGHDAQGVWSALDFLRAYCLGFDCKVGPVAVTIGGGDVSCDCSRSSLRCGASVSYQVAIESREEMPAQEIELRGGLEEGVVLLNEWGPDHVVVKDGKVEGIVFRKVLSRFDAQGRFNPTYSDEIKEIACDSVIFAVGQGLELQFMKDSGVAMDPRGRPIADVKTGATNQPGLFMAGDVTTGPLTIIIAMGQAHETAISVHRYLQQQDVMVDRRPPVHPEPYYLKKMYTQTPIALERSPARRVPMPESDPKTRVHTSEQVEVGWPKGGGHAESIRCMRCQTHYCVACTLCARVCPDNCIDVQGHDTGYERTVTRYDFVMEWCCFCGLCQDICPTQCLALAASFHYVGSSRKVLFYDKNTMLRPYDGPQEIVDKDGWP